MPTLARRASEVAPAERVPWDAWYTWFRREWQQDEHLTVIGPTGTGKTVLEIELARIRSHVVFIATKPADDVIAKMPERRGYTLVNRWPRYIPDDVHRILLWTPGGFGTRDAQRSVIKDAYTKIVNGPPDGKPGRWLIVNDEARVISDPKHIGLHTDVTWLLIEGRSIKVPMLNGFQRPSWVPQEAYDQASHLFIAADNDRRNLKRFQEIGGADGERVAETVKRLRRYEWAHVDARPGHGDVHIIRVPKERAL